MGGFFKQLLKRSQAEFVFSKVDSVFLLEILFYNLHYRRQPVRCLYSNIKAISFLASRTARKEASRIQEIGISVRRRDFLNLIQGRRFLTDLANINNLNSIIQDLSNNIGEIYSFYKVRNTQCLLYSSVTARARKNRPSLFFAGWEYEGVLL